MRKKLLVGGLAIVGFALFFSVLVPKPVASADSRLRDVEQIVKLRGSSASAAEYENLLKVFEGSSELHAMALAMSHKRFSPTEDDVQIDATFGAASEALARRKGRFDPVIAAIACEQVTLDVRVRQFVPGGTGTQPPRSSYAQEYLKSVFSADHGRDREAWFTELRLALP